MSKKSLILLGTLILIIISIGFFYFNSYESQSQGEAILIDEIVAEVETTPEPEQKPESIPEVKEFIITAKRFDFTPETITVNQGDKVRLIVTSIDVTHGFLISEYGVNERLAPEKTKIIEFTADKKGEFPIICNVACGSGHSNMRGKLIVN